MEGVFAGLALAQPGHPFCLEEVEASGHCLRVAPAGCHRGVYKGLFSQPLFF